MTLIRLLKGEWDYDPSAQLGRTGGFGAVFAGTGAGYGPVAIKRLHLTANDTAHRELDIANELLRRDLKYVISILDKGKDANSDHYFIVMPRAEKSLQKELSTYGTLDEVATIKTLLAIAQGLNEVSNLVHRDLKPDNVLYHDGIWKIADFGIARFVEESTSLNTLNGFLTAPYASPEQWRSEHATPATDIYALGCIAYTLLTGKPPFSGPQKEDYKKQHTLETPPTLSNKLNPRLVSLVSNMLRKPPNARPSIVRVLEVLTDLSSVGSNQGGGLGNLAQAGVLDMRAALSSDADQSQMEQRTQQRRELGNEAFRILRQISEDFAKRIRDAAPSAQYSQKRDALLQIRFGSAALTIEAMNSGQSISEGVFSRSSWDVIAGAIITVHQQTAREYIWGANLWYTNLGKGNEYRWWEVAYMGHPLYRKQRTWQPFAVSFDDIAEADKAASNTIHIIQYASQPRPIDDENVDDFCERWADLLAKAYRGEIRHPPYLPLT